MKSTAIELVAAAARLSAALQLRDGKIVSAAKGQLPPSLRRRIADHKAEIVALLQRGEGDERPECANPLGSKASGSPPAENSAGSAGTAQGPSEDIAPPEPSRSLDGVRPVAPCRACGSATYWAAQNADAWICQGCHATDNHPEKVRWHVVEDARRITAATRSQVGCSECKFSGVEFFAGGRWTVCRCKDGFGRRVASETGGAS